MLSFSSKPVEIFQKGRSYTKEEYDLEVVRRAMVSPHISDWPIGRFLIPYPLLGILKVFLVTLVILIHR